LSGGLGGGHWYVGSDFSLNDGDFFDFNSNIEFFDGIFSFILEFVSGVKGSILCFIESVILGQGASDDK